MRLIAAVIVFLFGASPAFAADVQRTLALSGLTCAACSAAVRKALKQIDGVRDVTVNDEQTQAVVVADETVPPAALIRAVEKAGYNATVSGTN